MQAYLRKSLIVSGLALAVAIIGQNASADPGDTVRWKSVIGIIQGNSVVGTGTGAITGAPGPWSAQGGSVSVDLDKGKFDFDVRGLVLAAGNSIGTPGSTLQVKGTLAATPTAADPAGIPFSSMRRSWISTRKATPDSTAPSARCPPCVRANPTSRS